MSFFRACRRALDQIPLAVPIATVGAVAAGCDVSTTTSCMSIYGRLDSRFWITDDDSLICMLVVVVVGVVLLPSTTTSSSSSGIVISVHH